MNTLIVTPTSRAVREISARLRSQEGRLPRLMRMDEFLSRLALVPGRAMIDPSERVLLLREAAEFEAFGKLQRDRGLIRFFTRSDDFFRFFEELSWERVGLEKLEEADAYAQYGEHLEILGELRRRYGELLEGRGFSDRMFLPDHYRFNDAFIQGFERIELYLEGYLSRFEMELLEAAARRSELIVHWRTTPFNEKMRLRFAEVGIEIPPLSEVSFSWSRGEILASKRAPLEIRPRIFGVQERYEQVALALVEIERMVQGGIDPERIALVLPREEFARAFALFDRMGNLNFSMGFDLKERREYRAAAALLQWWSAQEERDRELLRQLGLTELFALDPTQRVGAEAFFETMTAAGLEGFGPFAQTKGSRETEALAEAAERFARIHREGHLRLKEWLFLWLRELEALRLDDVRGGKVTVMGVLETRGVGFDGVVIVDFNEGAVPASSGKDRFLDSRVRHFAGLPDRTDREALQKHYYARLLERAGESAILYCRSDSRLPSRFLYELGLGEGREIAAPKELLYRSGELPEAVEPVVEGFEPEGMLWSASRLKTWLECRRKFYYRYLRGLPEKESDTINEGLVLHRLLDALYRERDAYADEEEMSRELQRLSADLLAGEEIRGLYLERYWSRKLEGFVRNEILHFSEGWRVVRRETKVEGLIEGLRFVGRIDRIDRRDDEILALDYKSGSLKEANRQSSLEKLTDFQMSIYETLLRPEHPKPSLAFVPILDGGGYVPPAAMEEKRELLYQHIAELKATRSFVAERTEDLSRCRYCPYQLLCGRGEFL